MAKRQRRVSVDEIQNGTQGLMDHFVNLVLRGGKVYFIRILKIQDSSLNTVDMKQHTRAFHFKEIQEVIIDI